MFNTLLAVGLVTVPGLYAFWVSQKLLQYMDDPLFAERVTANMTRIGSVAGISIGGTLLWLGPHRLLVIFLMLLGCIIGWFPARRKIFDESWSVFGFLAHTARFWIANLGGLWLIAVLPWAVQWSPRHGVVLGICVGVVALVWKSSAPRPSHGSSVRALWIVRISRERSMRWFPNPSVGRRACTLSTSGAAAS